MTDTTRQIIDFAADDNGAAMRDALYASIHDRVTQHLDTYKQELAKNLVAQPQEPEGATATDTPVSQTETETETADEE
jgi:hypothetical protein